MARGTKVRRRAGLEAQNGGGDGRLCPPVSAHAREPHIMLCMCSRSAFRVHHHLLLLLLHVLRHRFKSAAARSRRLRSGASQNAASAIFCAQTPQCELLVASDAHEVGGGPHEAGFGAAAAADDAADDDAGLPDWRLPSLECRDPGPFLAEGWR